MKKQLAISTWLMLILVPSTWAIDRIIMEVGPGATVNNYASALQALRKAVGDPKRSFFGIPMLRKPPNTPEYILVDLKHSEEGKTITLALNRSNLYAVGYADKFTEKSLTAVRAHFFRDAPSNAEKILFLDAPAGKTFRPSIPYASDYQSIEGKAQAKKMKLGIGMNKLRSQVPKVYGKALNAVTEKERAKFLLIAIQMVAEATRFKYIEDQVTANFEVDNLPKNYKVFEVQKEWGKISIGIRNANTKTEVINPAIQIVDANNNKVYVTQVKTIKPDMGLLNYVA